MRLGTTTLSVTQPGRRRRISAVAGGGGSGGSGGSGGGSGGSGGGSGGSGGGTGTVYFTDIDDYSFTRFDKINVGGTTDPCVSLRFKPDGTEVYTLDWYPSSINPTIRQQSLSTAWDISTHGSVTTALSPAVTNFTQITDLEFKPDGTQMWLVESDGDLRMYNLSTAWDISTATYSNDTITLTGLTSLSVTSIIWKSDGTSLYFVDQSSDRIYSYNFSTAWDITSSYTSQYSIELDLASTANESNPRGIYFSPDGLKLYITGYGTDDVFMYDLPTAWDITSFSGVYDSVLDTTPQESTPLGLTFSPDGQYMYLVGNGSDGVNQYTRQSSPPSNSIVTTNLALHLDAGDTNSYSGTGTTWTDLSTNSNNVTLVNGPTFSQGALTFDGTNDYATLSSTITFTDHTFEAWIYHTSPNVAGDYGYITTNATHGLAVSEGGNFGLPNGAIYYNNGGSVNLTNATLSSNVWTHLVATSEPSTNTLKIYFNGSLVSTSTVSNLGTSITRFNHFQGNGGLFLNAKLAQIRVYDDILTATEVLQNYNATKGTFHGLATSGLVAHYDASDTNSYPGTGTTVTDLSGNGNDATFVNGPTFTTDTGGAFVFDGTNDRITAPGSTDFAFGTGDHTFEVWFRPHGVATTYEGLVTTLYYTSPQGASLGTNNQGYITYATDFQANSTWNPNSTGVRWAANVWQHLVVTRENGDVKHYLNKSQIGTTKTNTVDFSSNNGLTLGTVYVNGYSAYDGDIGEARVYNRALSVAEIENNYNAGTRYTSVVSTNLEIHVDAGDTNSYSGTGTTWSDLTSNSHDLTLINGPAYSSTDGGIFDFDGANDYATSANSNTVSVSFGQDFSFDAWIKIDDTTTNSIFNIGDYSFSSGFILYTSPTGARLAVWTNNGLAFQAGSSGYVPTNTWKHVALSRSGSTVTVYLDGTSVGTFTHSAALSGQFDLALSKYSGTYSNPLNGKISNARLYIGKALTSAEVNQNYNALSGRF